jgi:ribulose-phosphate 3-epimerase
MIKVAPSILSADFGKMAEAVQNIKKWGADWVHCDVMDGVYVPNITFGMPMVKALRRYTDQILDVHLMITRPERYVGEFCDAGADYVTFHPEASDDVQGALDTIKFKGKKCGLVINADQSFDLALPYLSQIDLVLIMTVQAGFGGQSFKRECLDKAKLARDEKIKHGYTYDIELDGGVCPENIAECAAAGASVVVAGSSVFKAPDPKQAVGALHFDN